MVIIYLTLSTQSSFSHFFSSFFLYITLTHGKKNKLLENVCENIILQILLRRLIVVIN